MPDTTARQGLRADVRAAISTAYYDARNAGRTMEHAADDAADRVVAIVEEGA